MVAEQAVPRSSRTGGHLEVKKLRVAYGARRVLHGVDIDFPVGKVTAVIGPSGCGKCTLLSTLNRLSELSPGCKVGGQVLLDGRNVMQLDPVLVRRRVAMVFQRPNPFPMSIRDNILYGVKSAGLRVNHTAVVQACLSRAALWEETRNRLGESAFRLSLGQQQRLCLARALAISPSVLLMDEPTASLDPTSSARIEASIAELRGEYTIVIVTHNLAQAKRVSDYTAFLWEGELVEFDATEQLFTKPWRELTWNYINGAIA